MSEKRIWVVVGIFALAAIGCSQSDTPSAPAASQPPAVADSKYLLPTEPAGAKGVGETRKASQNDQEVVVVGRVGGDVDPFVEGAAAFTIVDLGQKPCEDGCPTPWDYCCAQELNDNKAVVKVVDAQGAPVAEDARKLLGVKPLTTVVVHGKAKRDDKGNLTVLADGVHVKQ